MPASCIISKASRARSSLTPFFNVL